MTPYKPLAIIAEITYRCPLKCVYCSNPVAMKLQDKELSTSQWIRLFSEGAKLGVVQLHLTGGEPLARPDVVALTEAARHAGLYTNLITSGVGLNEARLESLVKAGLDHVQLSFQDVIQEKADRTAGHQSHLLKLEAARMLRQTSLAFTINVVVHRHNLERLPEIILMAKDLGASRLEIAHVQYNGWAFQNREYLLPTREQVEKSIKTVEAARKKWKESLRIDFVVPDYFAKYPKACMGGWAQKVILVNPEGLALPCHSATTIPGLNAPNFKDSNLKWIWEESPAFAKFRGEAWMSETCRRCTYRDRDFGGCRCQALAIAGDARATDPVCTLSPKRSLVDEAIARAQKTDTPLEQVTWKYRENP